MKTLAPRPTRSQVLADELVVHEFDFAASSQGRFRYSRSSGGSVQHEAQHPFSVEDMVLAQLGARPLGALEADLRDVALFVHLSDRLARRCPTGRRDAAGLWWARRIRLRVGVRMLDSWSDPAVVEALKSFLYVITGDSWEIEFVLRRGAVGGSEAQHSLGMDMGAIHRQRWPHVIVALFSGGSDSLGGLAHQMREHPDARFVLVSVDSNDTVKKRQERQLAALLTQERARVQHVPIEIKLGQALGGAASGEEKLEDSSRTRSLLFLAGGAITARVAGRDRFFVYENGIGALNLAFSRAQVTGQATRAVHPRSLILFSRFVTALFRQPLHIENPFLFRTKGEVCSALNASGWRDLVPLTFTCSHPQRVPGGLQQCGACTSCILRRQGMRVAALSKEDLQGYKYLHDLSQPDAALGDKRNEWLAMAAQLHLIRRALDGTADHEAAWARLCQEFPELRRLAEEHAVIVDGLALAPAEVRRGLVRLLRTYAQEGLELLPRALRPVPEEVAQGQAAPGLLERTA